MTGTIAFQGVPGAYSDLACRVAYPDLTTLPCELFESAMDAVREGRAELAMLPCENSLAGRVPDIHHLLPESGLFVIGEHFHRVEHCLLGVKGAAMEDLKRAHSHTVALGQVRHSLRRLGLTPVVQADTAGAAQLVAQWNRKEEAAIASSLAAEIYGLEILAANVEDASHNTTRFYVMARQPRTPEPTQPELMTTFVFRVQERARGAVQGAGRLRDQWREHDQAGKLHARRPFRRHPVLVRRRRPSRTAGAAARAGGAVVLLLRGAGSGRLSRRAIPPAAGDVAAS